MSAGLVQSECSGEWTTVNNNHCGWRSRSVDLSSFGHNRTATAKLATRTRSFCLKPIQDQNYIFGSETDFGLNGAILKIPKGSELLDSLTAATTDPAFIPPWLAYGAAKY